MEQGLPCKLLCGRHGGRGKDPEQWAGRGSPGGCKGEPCDRRKREGGLPCRLLCGRRGGRGKDPEQWAGRML